MATTVGAASAERAFCDAARSTGGLVRRLAGSVTAPARVRGLLDQVDSTVAQALAKAPTRVSPTLRSLQASLGELHAAMDAVSYDVTRLAPRMVARAQSPEVFEMVRRLDAEVATSC